MECELTETPNLSKNTGHFYRFNLEIPAKSALLLSFSPSSFLIEFPICSAEVQKFEVKERIAADEQYRLRDITEVQVRDWDNEASQFPLSLADSS